MFFSALMLVQFFLFLVTIKASPYDARILHFLDPFFVNVAGDMAL